MDELEWMQLNDHDEEVIRRRLEEIRRRPRGRVNRGENSARPELSIEERLQRAREYLVDLDFELALGMTDKVLRSEPTAAQRAEAERLRASANRLLELRYGSIGDRDAPRPRGSLIS